MPFGEQAVVGRHLERERAFPSPTAAQMAEASRIPQYEKEYTEGIN